MKRKRIREEQLARMKADVQEMIDGIDILCVSKDLIRQVADKVAACKVFATPEYEELRKQKNTFKKMQIQGKVYAKEGGN